MNKSLKKLTSLFTAFAAAAAMMTAGAAAFGDDAVAITADNFSDPVFRRILLTESFDKDQDGMLSRDERSISEMQLSGRIDFDTEEIKTLDGIEYFPDLTILRCGSVGLETLDVSSLVNLEIITCQGNNLTHLDLSANSSLVTVNCSGNLLRELILPFAQGLATLQCYSNYLGTLNLSGLPNLRELRCNQNSLTGLDLSSNTMLDYINCSENCLPSLDLSKTALSGVTDYEIGSQEITLTAQRSDSGGIYIPFANSGLNEDNYRGSSLDASDGSSGFDFGGFSANDVAEIDGGIDYECYPMLASAENMRVHIIVEREFYQINFYLDSEKAELIGKRFVYPGETVQPPEITDTPQCSVQDGWSESIENPVSDMNVYPLWRESHSYTPALGSDGDTVTVTCSDCGANYQVSFKSLINAQSGDSRFDENVDVVADGYINAKDYAVLKNNR